MENELQIKELTRFCAAIHFNRIGFAISKTKLLKFLYDATSRVSENNSLRGIIPFYWYIHGPHSPPLLDLVGELQKDGILEPKGHGYIASNQRLCTHDECFQEIRQVLTEIITEHASSTSAVIGELYEQEAPCKFYMSFKSKFAGMLASYFHNSNTRFKHADIKDLLHLTVGELPNNTLFSRFKYAYLDFVGIMLEVTKQDLPDESKTDVEKTSQSVFETFAKGVRILHHDSYFESNVDDWKVQFEDSVNGME